MRAFAAWALVVLIGCRRTPPPVRADPLVADAAAKTAEPEILAATLAAPESLFVGKSAVLVALRKGGDRIVEVPKRGGLTTTVVPPVDRFLWALSGDATHVFFVDGRTHSVHALERTSGIDAIVGDDTGCGSSVSCALFADDSGVFWNGSHVRGSKMPTIHVSSERGLVVLPDSFVTLSRHAIHRIDRNSHASTVVADGFDNPMLIAANEITVAYGLYEEKGLRLVGSRIATVLGDAWVEAAVMNERAIYGFAHRGGSREDRKPR